MAAKHARTLDALERHFGVDRTVLLAIWSMESNYGAVLEKDDRLHYVPRALATLAYADPKRAKFAKTQLIAALKILQSGDVTPRELNGSWAGAMGHTQFIPTSYLLYGGRCRWQWPPRYLELDPGCAGNGRQSSEEERLAVRPDMGL